MSSFKTVGIGLLCVGINFSACVGSALATPPSRYAPAESIVLEEQMSPASLGVFACEQESHSDQNIEDEHSTGCEDTTTCIQQSSQSFMSKVPVLNLKSLHDSIGAFSRLDTVDPIDTGYIFPNARAGPEHQQAILVSYVSVQRE